MKTWIANVAGCRLPLKETAVIVFLAVNGWQDMKTKRIFLPLTIVFGMLGGVCSVLMGRSLSELLLSCSVGGMFMGLSILTRGKVGMGDGWILLALGTMLTLGELWIALGLGMLFTAVPAMVMLIILKKGRNTELPFVPFLLAGYIGGVCLW